MSWLRDRVMATLKGEPPGAGNLKVAVESGLESAAGGGSSRSRGARSPRGEANAAGRALLEGADVDPSRSSPEFDRKVEGP